VHGKPKIHRHDIPQLIVSPLREHSRKPNKTRERIARLTTGPYIELFARETVPLWDAWGLEAGLFDNVRGGNLRHSGKRLSEIYHTIDLYI